MYPLHFKQCMYGPYASRHQNKARRLYRVLARTVKCGDGRLSKAVHDQRKAPRQQPSAENRDGKGQIGGSPDGACAVQQVVHAALNHEDR
jgi:hypothetical protein